MNNQTTSPATKGFGSLIEEIFQHGLAPWTDETTARRSLQKVPVNILETEQAFTLQVIAPGMARENFNISIEKNMLTIAANYAEKTETPQEKWVRQEYVQRPFKRSFTLTDKVDTTNITAKYADGILTLHIAKQVPATPQTITVSVD